MRGPHASRLAPHARMACSSLSSTSRCAGLATATARSAMACASSRLSRSSSSLASSVHGATSLGEAAPAREARGVRPRLAGSPEASDSARSCSRLPRASASLGQLAAWAALAGRPDRPLFPTEVGAPPRLGQRQCLAQLCLRRGELAQLLLRLRGVLQHGGAHLGLGLGL
eukprot:scaffold29523_cov69-Phaeocystis_antarctica.AAC.6